MYDNDAFKQYDIHTKIPGNFLVEFRLLLLLFVMRSLSRCLDETKSYDQDEDKWSMERTFRWKPTNKQK